MLSIINPSINFSLHSNEYLQAIPFPHSVLEDFLKEDIANEVSQAFPDLDGSFWHLYSSPLEKKLTCDCLEHMPVSIKNVFEYLNSSWFLASLYHLTKIPGLVSDPELCGGGMHCTTEGGKLDIHLDSNVHRKSGLERRINLIIYLSENWETKYGGALEFWNNNVSKKIKDILPKFNRAVIFDVGDNAFHGVPDVLKCPSGITRRSLAVYYYTKLREGITPRYRAQFYKRPKDPDIPELQKLRQQRAGLDSAKSVWRVDG